MRSGRPQQPPRESLLSHRRMAITQSSVCAVNLHIRVTNVQPVMQHATGAIVKDVEDSPCCKST